MRVELPVSRSARLYRALLYLYPEKFRAAYGQQMRLTFRDACRVAYRRNGAGGLLALWVPTLFDLLKSALEERARQGEIMMSKARLIALAGPLTILVGSMWVVAAIGIFVLLTGLGSADTFWDNFWFFPWLLSFVPLLFALIGTRLRFHQIAGLPGRLGLVLSIGGCAATIVLLLANILLGAVVPVPEVALAGCLLSLTLGYMLFGVDALRYMLLPRWNSLALLPGAAAVFSLALDWFGVSSYDPWSYAGLFLPLAITGACWVLLGMAMMSQRQAHEEVAA